MDNCEGNHFKSSNGNWENNTNVGIRRNKINENVLKHEAV